ncbi:hypothetical protein cypCar_00026476 [Cyprinus carpio]|nr:hypothetical protein cypCar_00026476 [Cyprinus carpio]
MHWQRFKTLTTNPERVIRENLHYDTDVADTFKSNLRRNLGWSLILTAIKSDRTRVMEYIKRRSDILSTSLTSPTSP